MAGAFFHAGDNGAKVGTPRDLHPCPNRERFITLQVTHILQVIFEHHRTGLIDLEVFACFTFLRYPRRAFESQLGIFAVHHHLGGFALPFAQFGEQRQFLCGYLALHLLGFHRGKPGFEILAAQLLAFIGLGAKGLEVILQLQPFGALILSGQGYDGRRVLYVPVHGVLRRVVEERRHGVEVFHAERIKLVVVAHRAPGGQAHPHLRGGLGAVAGIEHQVLLADRASLVGGDVAAVEAGGHLLLERGAREQVPRQLLDGELVERLVAIEGVDHPVAVAPHLSEIVEVDAVGVGIAGSVQPVAGPVLPPVRGSQQFVHQLLVSIGRLVRHKRTHHRRIGRQSGQVQTQAAGQGLAIGLGCWRKALGLQARQNESVHRVASPGLVFNRRHRWLLRGDEGPVQLVVGPLLHPPFQNGFLLGFENLVRFGGRHDLVTPLIEQPLDQRAFVRLAGDNGAGLDRILPAVQTQVGLAGCAVWPVAGETVFRENRSDIPVVFEFGDGLAGNHATRPSSQNQSRRGESSCQHVHFTASSRKKAP